MAHERNRNCGGDSWEDPDFPMALFELKQCDSTWCYANSRGETEHTGVERRWWRNKNIGGYSKGDLVEEVVSLTVSLFDVD